MSEPVYKICDADAWNEARAHGRYDGSADDIRDGFIHFSTASQLERTAAKHFTAQDNLVLAAVDAGALGEALKWERSRGGALFPHLYGPLDMNAVIWTQPLPLGPDGAHVFPERIIS